MPGRHLQILSIHLGTPPTQFFWQWRDKDNDFRRDGEMTPQEFAEKYVTTPMEEYVCLVHDPRASSPEGRTFTIQYLGNVVDGAAVKYLNVDIELIKSITQRMLEEGTPVWMGCDTGKQMDRDKGLWDADLFDYAGSTGPIFPGQGGTAGVPANPDDPRDALHRGGRGGREAATVAGGEQLG